MAVRPAMEADFCWVDLDRIHCSKAATLGLQCGAAARLDERKGLTMLLLLLLMVEVEVVVAAFSVVCRCMLFLFLLDSDD